MLFPNSGKTAWSTTPWHRAVAWMAPASSHWGPRFSQETWGEALQKRWVCASLFVITQSRWGAKIKNVVPQILGTCCFCGNDTQCKCGGKPKENETSQCIWEMTEVWDRVGLQ